MILQHLYMPLLNFIHERFTYRISDRMRNLIFVMCFFMIFSLQFLSQYVVGYAVISRFMRDISICFFLGIVILLSVKKPLKTLKWRKTVYVPYTLAGILILVATIDHSLGPGHAYQAFPLVMLVGFICMYYVWGNRPDYETLFKAIAIAYFIFTTIIAVVCLFKYPYYDSLLKGGVGEYAPFRINPNGVAKIILPGLASGIYLFYLDVKKNTKYLYAIISGLFLAIIWLTRCRSAYVILVLFAFAIIFMIVKHLKNVDKRNISKALIVMLCILLIGAVFFQFVLKATSSKQVDISKENTTVVKIDKEKQVYLDEGYANIVDNEFLLTLNEYTSGRIAIWSVYFDNMSLFGGEERLFDRTEYAHNQYIELSYKAGIPVGPLYLLFVLGVGVIILRDFVKKDKYKEYTLFQVLIFSIFFVISMLDTGILPTERAFILLFYIIAAPCFFSENRKLDNNKKLAV